MQQIVKRAFRECYWRERASRIKQYLVGKQIRERSEGLIAAGGTEIDVRIISGLRAGSIARQVENSRCSHAKSDWIKKARLRHSASHTAHGNVQIEYILRHSAA